MKKNILATNELLAEMNHMLTCVDRARRAIDMGTYKMRTKELREYIEDEDYENVENALKTLKEMEEYLGQVVKALDEKWNKEIGGGSWLDYTDDNNKEGEKTMEKIFESKKVPTDTGQTIDLADVVWVADEAENISNIGLNFDGERWQHAVKLKDGSRWLIYYEFPRDVLVDENGERWEDDGALPWDDVDYIVRANTRD